MIPDSENIQRLIQTENLKVLRTIVELAQQNPNDQDLGEKVRRALLKVGYIYK